MGIAETVLDAVRTELTLYPGARASRAGLRIGALSGVEPESLRFCLEALVTGSDLDPLEFDFEIRPWLRVCLDCAAEFPAADASTACPICGSERARTAGGDEMEFAYLELEEPDARTA
jgi:hydrogenase nickel incorporation protein HypA/HybF